MTWIPTRTPNNDESGGCDTGLANHRSSDDCSGLNLQTQYSGQILTQPCDEVTLVADALAIGSARELREAFAAFNGRMVFTPHHGEMAMLTGVEEDTIAQSPEKVARDVATQYRSVVVIKGRDTVIAAFDGTTLHYGGGGTGLATGGSGDVLAGAIGGLLSRGAPPIIAAGWGVWLHGQSGRRVATTSGPIGFLAREVSAEFPRRLPQ